MRKTIEIPVAYILLEEAKIYIQPNHFTIKLDTRVSYTKDYCIK